MQVFNLNLTRRAGGVSWRLAAGLGAASLMAIGMLGGALMLWQRAWSAPIDFAQLASGLGYVHRNYGEAVLPHGGVDSAREFAELESLLTDALASAQQLSRWDGQAASLIAAAARAGLEAAPPAAVLPAIDAALAALARHHDLGWTPPAKPSWQRGKQLFGEACATCHGADGSGFAPVALATRPPNMRDASWVTRQSPAGIFGVVSYGVPESPMPSFAQAYSVAERWDLAFYTLALSRPAEIAERYKYPALKRYPLDELAIRSDSEIADRLARAGAVGSLGRTQLDYLRAEAPFVDH